MLKHKLALILVILLITAGCQQSYHQTTSDQYVSDQTVSSESIDDNQPPEPMTLNDEGPPSKDLNEKNNTKERVALTSSPAQGPAKTPPTTSDLIDSTQIQTHISDPVVQKKIDQALELCNYAQQMWEKGKLEDALTNLDSAYYSILEIDSDMYPEFNQQKEDIRYLISKRILEIYASRQIVLNGQHNEIPIILNKHVQKEIKRLTGSERKFLIQSLERSARYRPFIVSELKKAGLPEEISWLPLIESGFKIRALSHARALGLWQFIPSTGYKFGLNRNYYIDERLDPEKATRGAISYLKELHNLFGDWTTALAAYNCGESRVLRIIRKQKINYLDNFWDLYQNLPRETSRYVPRFLATLHIVNNLEKYNIKVKDPLLPIAYKTCEIKKQVRLKDISKEIGVKASLLKDLNPELRYALLPPEAYQLKIPEEKVQIFLSKIDTIKTTYSPPPMYVFHRVRKGETLSGIAGKYKTSLRAISNANNINRAHKIYAGKVLKIPSRSNGVGKTMVASHRIAPGKTHSYTVKRGDNLWIIARKFSTTTKNIMASNNLSGTTLSIGQILHISSKSQVKRAKKGASKYQVKSGDSPFSIAKKYKMSLNRLLALNQLSNRSKIFPGQNLIVD